MLSCVWLFTTMVSLMYAICLKRRLGCMILVFKKGGMVPAYTTSDRSSLINQPLDLSTLKNIGIYTAYSNNVLIYLYMFIYEC